MKTICIMNLKGGVGKTVTADNMAAILAMDHGKRVLLVDGDHQGNTSRFFHADLEAATLRDVLTGEAEPCWPGNVPRTAYEGLDILPADLSLAELDAAPGSPEGKNVWGLHDMLLAVQEDGAIERRLGKGGMG